MRRVISLLVLLAGVPALFAATYYVDFDAGNDTNAGTSKDAAWQHAPGDTAATGQAKAAVLQPGDTVKFKGGVVYRGSITIAKSGAAGSPIVYDGNQAGDWGTGRAVIDGSVPLADLQPCANAAEARGNPNWKKILWCHVPKGAKWNTLNVCQGTRPLAVSQDPNPADPVFQEDTKYYIKTEPEIPRTVSSIQVRALGGMGQNSQRPLITMFDGDNLSAVIENISGGGQVEVTLPAPATVVEFSVTPQPNYANPKDMSFACDGREVLKVEVANNPGRLVQQRFKLPQPVTFKTLVVTFISAWPSADGSTSRWGAVQAIAGYDAAGKNVLLTERRSELVNAYFSQPDPAFFDNALLALYATPAMVYYKRILAYDPAAHRIRFQTLAPSEAPYPKGGSFSIVNAVQHIDMPGEYALILDPEPDGRQKLFLWPPDGTPKDLTRGQYGTGIAVRGSFVTVQGFWVRKQGWAGSTGLDGRGPGGDVVIRDVKVTNLRGTGVGIHTTQLDRVLVEHCEVAENAGHTKGIVLRNARNLVVRGCELRRNSSTALDFYTVANSVVQDCRVIENPGMHANGLTFYVGCRDILVERNLVRDGNVALTVQDGENMIIRNNILEGGPGGAPAIGLWAGKPYNNIVITNNLLLHHAGQNTWAAAIYGGNPTATGYAVVNNIVAGLSGNVLLKADVHHNIFILTDPVLPPDRQAHNPFVPDLKSVFIDPDKGHYGLKAGSPAIGAGIALTTINAFDRWGVARAADGKFDIGPHEFVPAAVLAAAKPSVADPATFAFTFDGYTIAPPPVRTAVYEMKFRKREGAETKILKGVDRTGEGGGTVNLRTTRGGYISGWDKTGHWLEWTVDVEAGGFYELAIEHASEMPSERQVFLNGKAVPGLEKVAFPLTGAWLDFEKRGLPVALPLAKGKNVIKFVNLSGSLNFKTLEFIPVVSDQPVRP